MDEVPRSVHELESQEIQEVRLVIAIDYGTTFTGVAYATPTGSRSKLHETDVVTDWGDQMGNHDKIPSVYSYSPSSEKGEQQWGLSLAENAVAMVNTKLELDLHDVSEELDIILQALDGMKNLHFQHIQAAGGLPAFPWQGPEEIVTDYLKKVFAYLLQAVEKFSEELRAQIPVDIVFTVPPEWSYDAVNSTYQAITKAGFNQDNFPRLADVILVTEPEAAAVYTARYLKEKDGKDFLKENECFVLCDAGGGTVDLVSYKVKALSPNLELEQIALPTGDKCGSVYIDLAFKNWLRELVGEKNYDKLDPGSLGNKISSHAAEGEHMRKLMKAFDVQKRKFKKDNKDIRMDLPGPLKDLDLPGKVVGGEITIKRTDMAEFFDPCVDSIVQMIETQIAQIVRLKDRVKNVFLIGGFGESEYLQQEIEFSLKLRSVKLRRPKTSWTAVVRGAVIYGVEKNLINNLTKVETCPMNYGIRLAELFSEGKHASDALLINELTKVAMAVGQMKWLIKKGDAMYSNKPRITCQVFDLAFTEATRKPGEVPIYSYPDDEHLPDTFETAPNELVVAHALRYDLAPIPLSEFQRRPGPKKVPFYIATLKVTLILHGNTLRSELFLVPQQPGKVARLLDTEEIRVV